MTTGFWANSRRHIWAAVVIYTAGLAVLGLIVAGAILYFGFFNVSAQVKDAKALEWLLVTTREASIVSNAKGIVAPEPTGPAQIDNGFRLFQTECSMCHSVPGYEVGIMSTGLNPPAPPLDDLVDMTAAETFWVVKNGLRFTGMPAWQAVNTDAEMWDIVAFLMTSEDLTEDDLIAMGARTSPTPTGQ
uniref:c-type cytochrome n=1 Tax=Pararhizobium sp. IMCC3301 TaxID=3067904 RepID=UPI0027404B65|nr:cytochrome c [Pararhizobium sp. IMCC3301]